MAPKTSSPKGSCSARNEWSAKTWSCRAWSSARGSATEIRCVHAREAKFLHSLVGIVVAPFLSRHGAQVLCVRLVLSTRHEERGIVPQTLSDEPNQRRSTD